MEDFKVDMNGIRQFIHIPYTDYHYKLGNVISPICITDGVMAPAFSKAKLYIKKYWIDTYFDVINGDMIRNKVPVKAPPEQNPSEFFKECGIDCILGKVKIVGYPETEEFFIKSEDLDKFFETEPGELEKFFMLKEHDWFRPTMDYTYFDEFYITPAGLVKFLMMREEFSKSEPEAEIEAEPKQKSEKKPEPKQKPEPKPKLEKKQVKYEQEDDFGDYVSESDD